MEELLPIPAVSAFGDCTGSVFSVEWDAESVELHLVEVDTSADTVEGWERFSLGFEGPSDARIEQGLYRLEHPVLGPFDTTLVPVWTRDPDPERVHYQAVVDREVPDRIAGKSADERTAPRSLLGRAVRLLSGGGLHEDLLEHQPVASAAWGGYGDQMLGSVSMFAGNFAPRGYAFCDGQLLPISQNASLFSILGTTYGGDGTTTFALPDLRGRVPMHVGTGQGPGLSPRRLGEMGGSETVTLSETELPSHSHAARVDGDGGLSLPVTSAAGDATTPAGNVLAAQESTGNKPVVPVYSTGTPDGSMAIEGAASASVTIGDTGGSVAHANMPPYLGLNYVIVLEGTYPSRY